ncbi:MAG: hypothetical protein WDO69_09935 [Pseudomonadota bacterium]
MRSFVGTAPLAFLVAALIIGCSSSDQGGSGANTGSEDSSCSVVLSGGISETAHCNMALYQMPTSTLDTRPYIGGGDDTGRFGFQLFGVEPQTGTFTTGQGLTASGTANLAVDGNQVEWNVIENEPGQPDTGDYTLVVSSIVSTGSAGGVDKWQLDGTLDATFEADASNSQGGEVTLHMEF